MVGGDGVSDMLKHYRFARFGACHQQAALALADGSNQVDDTAGDIFLGFNVAFEQQSLGRKKRGKVFKQNFVLGLFRWLVVDLVHLDQREIAFAVLWECGFRLLSNLRYAD